MINLHNLMFRHLLINISLLVIVIFWFLSTPRDSYFLLYAISSYKVFSTVSMYFDKSLCKNKVNHPTIREFFYSNFNISDALDDNRLVLLVYITILLCSFFNMSLTYLIFTMYLAWQLWSMIREEEVSKIAEKINSNYFYSEW